MLPVVASPAAVARKILWYSYAMVAATLALVPYAGWIYGVSPPRSAPGSWPGRIGLTPGWPRQARTGARPPAPMRLFHLSIAYLTLLFAAVAVTALLPWGHW